MPNYKQKVSHNLDASKRTRDRLVTLETNSDASITPASATLEGLDGIIKMLITFNEQRVAYNTYKAAGQ
jgi:hypothetical protein